MRRLLIGTCSALALLVAGCSSDSDPESPDSTTAVSEPTVADTEPAETTSVDTQPEETTPDTEPAATDPVETDVPDGEVSGAARDRRGARLRRSRRS